MKKYLALIGCFFCLWANGQVLNGARTGKDSVSIETSMVVMTEKFTTAEINAFTRTTANKPAYVFNSDTETLWAWTGTEWKDLGLAPVAGGITVDQTVQNGSTNPVENNAVYDRFVKTVDEAPDSPHNDIEWWFGTKAEYDTADKTNPRRFFLVSDSIYDPGPDGNGDAYIENMFVSGNQLTVEGQGGAFNGSLTLPGGGGGTDDQIIEQFVYSHLTKNLTLRIENAPTQSTSLAPLFQDARDVPFEDQNLSWANADDVQEIADEAWETGSEQVTNITIASDVSLCTLLAGEFSSIDVPLKSSLTTVYWSRSGPNIHFTFDVEIDDFTLKKFQGGSSCNQGAAFSVNIPNPLPFTPSRPEALNVSFVPFWNNGSPILTQFKSYQVSENGWAFNNTINASVHIEWTGDPGEQGDVLWSQNKLFISGTYRID